MECKYIIMGKPIAWARAGRSRRGYFDTQTTEKEIYAYHFRSEHKGLPLFAGPIHLEVTFFMPITKTGKKRLGEKLGVPHIFTPDLSNLIKFVEDAAANDILFHDDCIISSITARKVYDKLPRTEIILRELLS
jgi:Holliday junction resolvase RusA-like endonuclease